MGNVEKSTCTDAKHSRVFLDALFTKERAESAVRKKLAERMTEEALIPKVDAVSIGTALSEEERAIGFWRYIRFELDKKTREVRLGIPSYFAWVVSPNGSFSRVDLGPADKIDSTVAEWRGAIGVAIDARNRGVEGYVELPNKQFNEHNVGKAGRKLRRLVFDPLLPALGGAKRLVVALDDALHLVPLSALPLDNEETLVGDRYDIVVRTTLKEMTVDAKVPLSPPSLLALGGIDYDAEPLRFHPNGDGVDRSTEDERKETEFTTAGPSFPKSLSGGTSGAPVRLLRDVGRSQEFIKLPQTLPEIQSIAAHFQTLRAKDQTTPCLILDGAAASRDALTVAGPKCRFIHIATHGYFAPESVPSMKDESMLDWQLDLRMSSNLRATVRGSAPMMLCGLAFAGANRDPDAFGIVAGVMTAAEISELDLRGCELVVLSACETNVGVRRAGQGIASLQQALFAAGTRASITSLWGVPDKPTRILMADFYRRMWIEGKPKRQALWEAQQVLRNKKDEEGKPVASMRDWAAWVLVGDG